MRSASVGPSTSSSTRGDRPDVRRPDLPCGRFFEPVDRRDVRMIERGEDLGLALEAGEALGVVCEQVGQDLERDVATELRVARAIDLAHAAGAEQREDFVGTETRSCRN